VTAYAVSMLEMGDKSCIGVAIYCGSDGTSTCKSSLTFAARAGSMRTVLHKRNLFAGERFDLDTLNHDNIDDRVSPQHRHREDSATAFQLRTKDVS
jgi:hypothetical protein